MKEVSAVKDKAKIALISDLLTKHHGQHFSDIWNIGIQFAFRITDLLKLTFKELEGTHIEIIENKTEKPVKRLINSKAREIINRRKSENPDDIYLFQAKARNAKIDKPLTRQAVGQAFKAIGEIVGVELGTHSMRKTRGYHVYQIRHDIGAVMQLLNHSSPKVTLRYIGITQEDQDNLSNELIL